jgi:UDPglucose 6-dehydrogenase
MLEGVHWCESTYETMEGADVVTILTEWNEFRALDLKRVKNLMSKPVMVDLRNIYNPDEMIEVGFEYYCVGRKNFNGS